MGGSAPVETTKPSPVENSAQVVNGTKVQYGKHNYGVNNQNEYDKVMEIVNNAMKRYKEKTITKYTGMFGTFLDAYLKGETITVDRGLTEATRTFGKLKANGVSSEVMGGVYKLIQVAFTLSSGSPQD